MRQKHSRWWLSALEGRGTKEGGRQCLGQGSQRERQPGKVLMRRRHLSKELNEVSDPRRYLGEQHSRHEEQSLQRP